MRRGRLLMLLTAGLALSHAGVWWLGSAISTKPSAADLARHPDPGGSLDPEDPTLWTPAALARRGAERERARVAELAAQEEEAAQDWEELVAAARRKFPPGGDPAAILAEALKNPDGDFTPEQVAAFGVWLDRDAAAALAWSGLNSRDHGLGDLEGELQRWLGEGGYRDMNEYLDRFPLAAEALLQAARDLAQERGPEFALALADVLPNPSERMWMILSSFDSVVDLSGHLAAIRSRLNERQAAGLLDSLTEEEALTPAFLAEIRAAGFPAKALAEYEEWVKETQEEDEEAEGSYQAPVKGQGATRLNASKVRELAPDFPAWCGEAGIGKITPQEVMARLVQAWPETPGPELEELLRSQVTHGVLEQAPVETLRWLRETTSEREWRASLQGALGHLNPEQISTVLADLPPGMELDASERRNILSQLDDWIDEDPQGFHEAQQRIAADEAQPMMSALMREQREKTERRRQLEQERALEEQKKEQEAGP